MLNSHTWQNRSRVYSVCNAESHMWYVLILLSVHVRCTTCAHAWWKGVGLAACDLVPRAYSG